MSNEHEIICTRCMRYHPPPLCDHDAELRCFTCGGPRGYRWNNDAGQPAPPAVTCWRCWAEREGLVDARPA